MLLFFKEYLRRSKLNTIELNRKNKLYLHESRRADTRIISSNPDL